MGLFGQLDADEVSDNPFYVAPDDYECVLAEAEIVDKKDGSGQGLSFKWVIEDEDSDYQGSQVSDWLNIYPEITREDMTAKIRQDLARLKKRLGEMGLTPAEQDILLEDENLENLIGMTAVLSVTESKNKQDPTIVYTNIGKVTPLED